MACTSPLAWVLFAAVVLLAATASAADECKLPGCAKCAKLTDDEVAALKAKWEAKLAKKKAEGKVDEEKLKKWQSKWAVNKDGTPRVFYKCLECLDDTKYELRDSAFCACKAGYGWPLSFKPTKDGSKPLKPATAPTCETCAEGYVSGPDAPKPEHKEHKGKWGGAGARNLLGKRKGGGWHHAFCVPCPEGKKANAAKTACA